jgi:excisionase family DNA binding protein
MPSDSLLTAEEMAEVLNVRPSTVLLWARRNRIPAVRLSPKVVRFNKSAVLAAVGTSDATTGAVATAQ